MKKFLLLTVSALVLLSLNNVNAQCDLPFNEDGEYEIKEVVSLKNSIPDTEIYGAAMLAFTEVFNSAADVIDIENENLGYISGQFDVATKPFTMGVWQSHFRFSIRLDFKDSRYRIKVKYLSHYASSSTTDCHCPNKFSDEKCGVPCVTKKQWKKQKCEAHTQVLVVITKIKKLIGNNLTVDDNW